jgi:sterol desaturase/sphingolipid hydroxylase (fatty acid hydroxylase superfamily)
MHSPYASERGDGPIPGGTGGSTRASLRALRWPFLAGTAGLGALAVAGIALLRTVEAGRLGFGDPRLDWLAGKVAGRIGDNLHDMGVAPANLADRFCLVYLAAFLVFGAVLWALRRREAAETTGLLAFLFPKAVYRHRSVGIDVGVFLVNRVFSPAVLVTRLLTAAWLGAATTAALTAAFGAHERTLASTVWDIVAFTGLTTLMYDFSDYLSHALLHRIPVLWQFHRLHHSAEVLMPLTVARVHPVEQVFGALVATPIAAIASGIAGYFFLEEPSPLTFLGAQVVSVAFFAAGYHLRHSHVWLDWGPIVGRILISPAQHQIHHSSAPQHHDRNYGFIFAIWDWMFRTQYLPRGRETLSFGLYGEPRGKVHTTLWQAYVEPFQGAAAILLRRRVRPVGDDAAR